MHATQAIAFGWKPGFRLAAGGRNVWSHGYWRLVRTWIDIVPWSVAVDSPKHYWRTAWQTLHSLLDLFAFWDRVKLLIPGEHACLMFAVINIRLRFTVSPVGERTNACCIIVAGCFQKYREYCTNDADSHIQRGRKRKSQYEQKRRGTANRRFSQSRTDRRKQTEDSRGMLAFVFVMQIMIKALSDRARRRASKRPTCK